MRQKRKKREEAEKEVLLCHPVSKTLYVLNKVMQMLMHRWFQLSPLKTSMYKSKKKVDKMMKITMKMKRLMIEERSSIPNVAPSKNTLIFMEVKNSNDIGGSPKSWFSSICQ